MKKIFLLLSSSFFCLNVFSQAYSGPESVEFDYANNRWFISNHSSPHTIITRNSSNGVRAAFASGLTSGPHGLEIVNDTLYACDGGNLRGYNINTAALVFTKAMGATFLNGITHDNSGNLYVTDYSGNKIYRFNIATRQSNVFVSGLSSPNGIIYDQPNNRCVFVQWTGAIKAVSLVDSTISTVLASSGLSSVDGIAKDGSGNYYVSSWGGNKVTRYTNTFTTPTVVITGLSSPADIFYNVLTDTLGVPNSGTLNNTVYYYFGSATGVTETASAKNNLNLSVNPNPVVKAAEINYVLPENSKVTIQLFDMKGALVKTIIDEEQTKGAQTTFFSKSNLAGGQYLVKIQTGKYAETKNIIISE